MPIGIEHQVLAPVMKRMRSVQFHKFRSIKMIIVSVAKDQSLKRPDQAPKAHFPFVFDDKNVDGIVFHVESFDGIFKYPFGFQFVEFRKIIHLEPKPLQTIPRQTMPLAKTDDRIGAIECNVLEILAFLCKSRKLQEKGKEE
jgi:hypothetical protein